MSAAAAMSNLNSLPRKQSCWLGTPEIYLRKSIDNSRLLKVEDRLGTLETGKIADVVAVPGDPLEKIELMRNVVFVMKEGVVYKNP